MWEVPGQERAGCHQLTGRRSHWVTWAREDKAGPEYTAFAALLGLLHFILNAMGCHHEGRFRYLKHFSGYDFWTVKVKSTGCHASEISS